MLGSAVSSSTPTDFHPNPVMGLGDRLAKLGVHAAKRASNPVKPPQHGGLMHSLWNRRLLCPMGMRGEQNGFAAEYPG